MKKYLARIVVAAILVYTLPLTLLAGCGGNGGAADPNSIALENGSAVVTDVEYLPSPEDESAVMRTVMVILEVTLASGEKDSAERELMDAAVLVADDGTEYSVTGFNFDLPGNQLGVGYFVEGTVDVSTLTFKVGNYSVRLADYR